jgi:hypothetical protein
VWVDTSASPPKAKYWDGSSWTAKTFVGGEMISSGTVNAEQIKANTLTASEIASESITASEVQTDTLTATEIATDTLTATEIAADAITATEISADAVTADAIDANTVTATELKADTITSSEVKTGTLTAAQIAANTLTADEISSDAITANEISADAVTASQISADAVQTEQLKAGAAKLGDVLVSGNNQTRSGTAPSSPSENDVWIDTSQSPPVAKYWDGSAWTKKTFLGGEMISSQSITADKVAAGTLTATQIKTDSITADVIGAGEIKAGNIAADAVQADQLKADAAKLGDVLVSGNNQTRSDTAPPSPSVNDVWIDTSQSPPQAKYWDGSAWAEKTFLGGEMISSGTVNAEQVKAGALTATEIKSGSLTSDVIEAGAITTQELDAAAVTADEISADAITTAKISAGAVQADSIGASVVSSSKIRADAITTSEIAAGAVTASQIGADAVTATEISADSVTATQIAADAVTSSQINADAVTTAQLSADSVTATEIATDAIDASSVSADSITGTEIDATATITIGTTEPIKIDGTEEEIRSDNFDLSAETGFRLSGDPSATLSFIDELKVQDLTLSATATMTGDPVATRSASPNDRGAAVWSADNNRFESSAYLSIEDTGAGAVQPAVLSQTPVQTWADPGNAYPDVHVGTLEGLPRKGKDGSILDRTEDSVAAQSDLASIPRSEAVGGKRLYVDGTGTWWELDTSRTSASTGEVAWNPPASDAAIGVWLDTGDTDNKHDVGEYGVWLRPADQAVVEGDLSFDGGTWTIGRDGSFQVQDGATSNPLLKMGKEEVTVFNDTLVRRGFHAYDTDGVQAFFTRDGFSFGGGLLEGGSSELVVRGNATVEGSAVVDGSLTINALSESNASGEIPESKLAMDFPTATLKNNVEGKIGEALSEGKTIIEGGSINTNILSFSPVDSSDIVGTINSTTQGGLQINADKLGLTASDLTINTDDVAFSPVETDNVIGSINTSAEGITISADKLGLTASDLTISASDVEFSPVNKSKVIFQINSTSQTDGTGSTVRINGANLEISSETTFFGGSGIPGSELESDYATVGSESQTFRQSSAPAGADAAGRGLQAGDLWIDTDDGDKPYTYDGTQWVQSYTTIDGGNIETGTVTTQTVDFSPVETGSVVGSINASPESVRISGDRLDIDSNTVFFGGSGIPDAELEPDYAKSGDESQTLRQPSAPTDADALGRGLVAGDMWIDTDDGNKPYTYNGSSWVQAYTQIGGGSIETGAINADHISISDVKNLDADAATSTDTSKTLRQTAEPTAADVPDRGLQAGDVWIDTDDGDRPYTYDGSSWNRAFTQIQGGDIVAGAIDTTQLDTSSISVTDIDPSAATKSDTSVTIQQTSAPTDSAVSGRGLQKGDIWIDTSDGNRPHTYDGTGWTRSYTAITGDDIQTGTISADEISVGSVTDLDSDAAKIADTFSGDYNDLINDPSIPSGNLASLDKISNSTYIGNGVVSTGALQADAIVSGKIAAGAVTATQVAADTITANEVAADAITTDELKAGAAKIGDVLVAGNNQTRSSTAPSSPSKNDVWIDTSQSPPVAKYWDGTAWMQKTFLGGEMLATGSVSASQIAADTITASEISADAITASEIAADTITSGEISAGAVTATEISVTSVTDIDSSAATDSDTFSGDYNDLLNQPSIPSGNLADLDSISSSTYIGAGVIDTGAIAADAISSTEIAANAVSATQINVTSVTDIDSDAATESDTFSGNYYSLYNRPSIPNGDLADLDEISSSTYIGPGVIDTGVIAADAISSQKIASNAITTTHLDAGSISVTDLDSDAATTADTFSGDYNDLDHVPPIPSGDLADKDQIDSSTYIGAGVIDTGAIAADAITATEVAANAISATQISVTSVTDIDSNAATDSDTFSGDYNDLINQPSVPNGALADLDSISSSTYIGSGVIDTGALAADAVTATEIAAGSITSSEIDTTNLFATNYTMKTGGKITNSNNDFEITESGFHVYAGDNAFEPEKSYSIGKHSDLYSWGFDGLYTFLRSEESLRVIGGDVDVKSTNDGGSVTVVGSNVELDAADNAYLKAQDTVYIGRDERQTIENAPTWSSSSSYSSYDIVEYNGLRYYALNNTSDGPPDSSSDWALSHDDDLVANQVTISATNNVIIGTAESPPAWDSGVTYNRYDKVQYGGIRYRAVTETSDGPPDESFDWYPAEQAVADQVKINATNTVLVDQDLDVNGTVNSSSDERDKNIVGLVGGAEEEISALEKTRRLDGIRYEWKEDIGRPGGLRAGVTAQQLETVLPEAVSEYYYDDREVERKMVSYQMLHALHIETATELAELGDERDDRISEMESRIDQLETENERLRAQIEEIRSNQ